MVCGDFCRKKTADWRFPSRALGEDARQARKRQTSRTTKIWGKGEGKIISEPQNPNHHLQCVQSHSQTTDEEKHVWGEGSLEVCGWNLFVVSGRRETCRKSSTHEISTITSHKHAPIIIFKIYSHSVRNIKARRTPLSSSPHHTNLKCTSICSLLLAAVFFSFAG